jgi:Calpain family cysteine protease
MGAGSPAGSDSDVSNMGIVQGHAYSLLDVCEVEGNKLIQLRNPWGEATEWKGAWSDSSKEWNERRRRIVYERMKQRGVEQVEIGREDGTFWISLSDYFANFE